MPEINWDYAVPIVGFLLVFLGTWLTVRGGRKNSLDDRMVADQARTDKRISDLEAALKAEKRDRRVLEDHVYELRQWIADDKGPPPPRWPAELSGARDA